MTWFQRQKKRTEPAPKPYEPPWVTYGMGRQGWVVHLRTPSHDMGTSHLSPDEAHELGEALLNYAEVARLLRNGHKEAAACLAAALQDHTPRPT